jgi:alpha-L-rhamnosidase
MIYCLKATQELAELLNVEAPSFALAGSPPAPIPSIIDRLTAAHRTHYYDSEREVFVSGKDRQISWAANAWAVLAAIPESRDKAAKAMQVAYESKESVVGMTPYLHHYVSSTAKTFFLCR